MPIDNDPSLTGVDDAANDADQRGLAGPIGPQQGQDLSSADVEVDAFERLKTRSVGFGQTGDGNDGLHGPNHN